MLLRLAKLKEREIAELSKINMELGRIVVTYLGDVSRLLRQIKSNFIPGSPL